MDRNNNMLLISLLILFSPYVLGKPRSDDLEIQARLHLDPGFVRRIEDNMDLQQAIFENVHSLGINLDKIQMNDNDEYLDKIIKKRTSRKMGEKDKTNLAKYEERVQRRGLDSLKAVAEHLQMKLRIDTNTVTPILNKICFQYISKLKSYFVFLSKKRPYYELDKEYVILDMVNIVSYLLNSVEKTLLNQVLATANRTSKEDKQILTETIDIYNMNYKKNEMQYICRTMRVCRPCPGFSDYFIKILSEVLKLYDVKFQYFILKSSQLLNSKRAFFETIIRDEILDRFRERTKNIMNVSITDVREIISVLRSGISQKQRLVATEDESIKTKTKASRIIIDILDKAFDFSGDEYMYINMDTTISAIQQWAASQRNDIESILNTFINQLVSTLKFDLSALAKDEIKTLGDIIYYGKAIDSEYMEEYLMEKGSKFVNGLTPPRKQVFVLH